MSALEVLAYAITHAPKGVKGGPYESGIALGTQAATLREATRWPSDRPPMPQTLRAVRKVHPHARIIRIIRIVRARPSEASAVEVLRELVAWDDLCASPEAEYAGVVERARRVLAAAGPDPMPVVRAAMAEEDARVRMVHASYAELHSLEGDWLRCVEATRVAVKAYRKAGGK